MLFISLELISCPLPDLCRFHNFPEYPATLSEVRYVVIYQLLHDASTYSCIRDSAYDYSLNVALSEASDSSRRLVLDPVPNIVHGIRPSYSCDDFPSENVC